MTAPEHRRPLPALAFIAALCLLTALVWFRVLHRTDASADAGKSACPTKPAASTPAAPNPAVLPALSQVSVLVLNSTQRNGIAAATKTALVKQGFRVTQATNDAKSYGGHGVIKGVAEIRYGPKAAAGAKLLHFYLPAAAMKANRSTSAVVTVSLGNKFKTLTTATAVHAALTKSHLSISAAPTPTPTASASTSC